MGYYSTMHYCNFRSNLSLQELQERMAKPIVCKVTSEQISLAEDYLVQEVESPKGDSGRFEIACEGEEFYSKHYNSDELADYLAEVIAPGEHTMLEFNGEDGANWSYLILPGEVKEIEYVAMVDGVLLEDYVAKHEGKMK